MMMPSPSKRLVASSVTVDPSTRNDRCSELLDAVHDAIAATASALRVGSADSLSLLDIGCWDGTATSRYGSILGGKIAGIEVFEEQASRARQRGIDVASIDLERKQFPWGDATFDVVICNQVFEHLKNIFHPMSEIARVLRVGGTLVFSVPNLASLHNRALLLLGRQPSSIRVPGPHVRGYAFRQIVSFLTAGGVFEIDRAIGVGTWRYGLGSPIVQRWPAASHTPVVVARKIRDGAPWRAYADGEQTFYEGQTESAGNHLR